MEDKQEQMTITDDEEDNEGESSQEEGEHEVEENEGESSQEEGEHEVVEDGGESSQEESEHEVVEDGGERSQGEADTDMVEDGGESIQGEYDEGILEEEKKDSESKKKKTIPGIIYLGHIPPRLRPRNVRTMLSVYGEVGRIFLQPEKHFVKKRKKKAGARSRDFTEGWVEFRDKRVAKRVAASLNRTQMGNRKKSRFFEDLWCMKYLHRFEWSHLHERLAIERQVRRQRMRAEVSQVKKETDFYVRNVERSKKFDKHDRQNAAEPGGSTVPKKQWGYLQRKTEEEIKALKSNAGKKRMQRRQKRAELEQEQSRTNVSLLQKIFNTS
ncbi:hypothetical protein GDO81_018806 [Engystomops pustulosus]|nr:hypothetical protein GDO81_018806 [Engystomops pustulosus]